MIMEFNKIKYNGSSNNRGMDFFVKSLYKQYMKALSYLEDYAEYIIEFTDYTLDDIVIVDVDLGNHRMCKMVICPKSCVVDGLGILPCDYFIGLEDIHSEEGSLKGWDVIFEIPEKLKYNEKYM